MWRIETTRRTLSEMPQATICYSVRGREILLGLKKERFGMGKWNGFGEKVHAGERIEDAAVRELREECGLVVLPASLSKRAVPSFYFAERPVFECHMFFTDVWEGEPEETQEMRPRWFSFPDIPYKDMWASDTYWLPRSLSGERLKGVCRFNAEGTIVETFELGKASF